MVARPGTVFAGYLIERRLGAGGMGTVYLARHPRLPRSVALKVIHPGADDPAFRDRFAREADLAARLDHPNVVEIYDRGEENGQLWIAMRYVAGRNAAHLIGDTAHPAGQGPATLPPRRVVGIIAQAAEGLDAAHRRGLLHRDVKPANLLVGTDDDGGDHVYVSDFGLAPAIAAGHRLTETGAVVATLGYVSPEQIRGTAVDHRADIYALGCTLYHLLTGTVPFSRATPAAVLTAHLNEPPPRPSRMVPGLPPAFDDVVATAMAKDPAARFPTCRELATTATKALTAPPPTGPVPHTPIFSPPCDPRPAPAEPDRVTATRNRTTPVIAAVTVVVATMVALAILTIGPFGDSTRAAPTTTLGPLPPPAESSTVTSTPAPTSTRTVTAWGRDNDLVALFPDLLPLTPNDQGYQGVRCADIDVLNNGGAPALHCTQDNGIEYYVWSFRRGDPRRDSTFTTNIDNDTTREEPWSRPSGSGKARWSHYRGADTGLLTVAFDDPTRARVIIDVSWPQHTGQDIYDLWWSAAPV